MIALYFYLGLTGMIACLGGMALFMSEEYFNVDEVLNNKRDFTKMIFGFHLFVLDICEDFNINLVGTIILEILITPFVIPYCIGAFIIGLIFLMFKYIANLFIMIFQKKVEEDGEL